MRPVDPPKPVEVRHGDGWHAGWLEAWRRDGAADGWRAYVRYRVAVGMQHLLWVSAEDVRLSPI